MTREEGIILRHDNLVCCEALNGEDPDRVFEK
jgi:hypothetical protein